MTEPFLLNVPDVLMNFILKRVDFRSILVLRKVCHDLRNFIDEYKPESHLQNVGVCVTSDSIKLDMPFNIISLNYQKSVDGCLITSYKSKQKLLLSSDFIEVFLEDFKSLLQFQKDSVNHFYFHFKLFSSDENNFLKRMEQSLKSWDHPIPIQRFNSTTVSQKEIMSILPYLDAKCLKTIELSTPDYDRIIPMEMNQIIELNQWKNGKTVTIQKLMTSTSLHHFSHFSRVTIVCNFLTGQDVTILKDVSFLKLFESFQSVSLQMFLASTSLKSFQVNAKCVNIRQYCEILGPASTDRSRFGKITNAWTYNIPQNDRCLKFNLSGEMNNWMSTVSTVTDFSLRTETTESTVTSVTEDKDTTESIATNSLVTTATDKAATQDAEVTTAAAEETIFLWKRSSVDDKVNIVMDDFAKVTQQKPPELVSVVVQVHETKVSLKRLYRLQNGQSEWLDRTFSRVNKNIPLEAQGTRFEGMDLISKAFHDLNAIMEGHNNNFSWFFLQLNCRNWLGTEEYKKINARAIGLLNTNLRSKHALVKVKKFEMHATEEEILQVLPYFDPKSIKSLDLHIHDHKKEKLLLLQTRKELTFWYINFVNMDHLLELLGNATTESVGEFAKKGWSFPIPGNENEELCIEITSKWVLFKYVEAEGWILLDSLLIIHD
ncbi:hypothetical protein CRE_05076 [Caenorhabditis remanei]|uniref:F-box domain-containing protein n=1 Tax=Caenorhabditis remanei TaxID=31234 RepID=E3MZ24_CAERE|nr:hypothetical protein CRE_05076 [Caenorhabditis remanei]